MKILLGPEYVSEEEETDSEEASEGEKEDARDTFVDRTTVRLALRGGTPRQEGRCTLHFMRLLFARGPIRISPPPPQDLNRH